MAIIFLGSMAVAACFLSWFNKELKKGLKKNSNLQKDILREAVDAWFKKDDKYDKKWKGEKKWRKPHLGQHIIKMVKISWYLLLREISFRLIGRK